MTAITGQRIRRRGSTINQGVILLILGLGAIGLASSIGSQASSPWLVHFMALAGVAAMWMAVVLLFRATRTAQAISRARSRE